MTMRRRDRAGQGRAAGNRTRNGIGEGVAGVRLPTGVGASGTGTAAARDTGTRTETGTGAQAGAAPPKGTGTTGTTTTSRRRSTIAEATSRAARTTSPIWRAGSESRARNRRSGVATETRTGTKGGPATAASEKTVAVLILPKVKTTKASGDRRRAAAYLQASVRLVVHHMAPKPPRSRAFERTTWPSPLLIIGSSSLKLNLNAGLTFSNSELPLAKDSHVDRNTRNKANIVNKLTVSCSHY